MFPVDPLALTPTVSSVTQHWSRVDDCIPELPFCGRSRIPHILGEVGPFWMLMRSEEYLPKKTKSITAV
jgi:hypothetical protein